jgi:hypothetical protein
MYVYCCAGGTGHCVFASYSAAVFFVGGSGITFALSAVQDILQVSMIDHFGPVVSDSACRETRKVRVERK